jgi:hypothetical protein
MSEREGCLSDAAPGVDAATGVKYDGSKRRYSLLPWAAVRSVVDVLEYGARKYAPDNWRKVPDARRRYYDATMRHVDAWWAGELLDSESHLPHLAHAACCVIFLLAFELDPSLTRSAESAESIRDVGGSRGKSGERRKRARGSRA